jgi:hypothetical protein
MSDRLLEGPPLSPRVIVFVGGGSWMVGFVTVHRRYS